MLYVALQIWFELALAFVAGGLTVWWWLRERDAPRRVASSEEAEFAVPRSQAVAAPAPAGRSPTPRPRPPEPSLPPSLVALAAEAEPDATPPGEASRPTLTGSDGTDPRPAVTPSPTTRDDLTRIRGVGPVLQRKLREMGVVSLEEIASWTPDDVARVQARLSGFPDRIRRDRWVDQARDLLSENR